MQAIQRVGDVGQQARNVRGPDVRKSEQCMWVGGSTQLEGLVLGGFEDLLETYFFRCGGVQINLSSN